MGSNFSKKTNAGVYLTKALKKAKFVQNTSKLMSIYLFNRLFEGCPLFMLIVSPFLRIIFIGPQQSEVCQGQRYL